MLTNLVCPVSAERVDSHVSRLTVFINAALTIVFIFTLQPVLLYVVTIDYGIRAAGYNQYSPLCFLASVIIKLTGSKPKMIDKGPKVFASRLGFLCLLSASILVNLNMALAAQIISAMATSLFLLDASGIVCVGCLIYHHLVFPYFGNKAA